jgi:hypothetical protein
MKGNHFEEDRFFDDMDTENQYKLTQAPARAQGQAQAPGQAIDSQEEVDPLDAFMMGVESEAKKDLIVALEHTYNNPLNTNVGFFLKETKKRWAKMRSCLTMTPCTILWTG